MSCLYRLSSRPAILRLFETRDSYDVETPVNAN
jgi:hypothetical protein